MTDKAEEKEKPDEEGRKPIVSHVEPTKTTGRIAPKETFSRLPWLQIGLDAALVIVTTILAIYTYKLAQSASTQAEASKTSADAARISAEAALRGVAATEDANELSKQIAEGQERFAKIEVRAYVTVGGVQSYRTDIGHQVKVTTEIENAGKTPAYNVRSRSGIKIGTSIYESEIKYLPPVPTASGSILGAGQKITIEASGDDFRKVDSINVATGKYTLFVVGTITYKDKFGDVHHTRYCKFFRPRDKQFLDYEKWNDAN